MSFVMGNWLPPMYFQIVDLSVRSAIKGKGEGSEGERRERKKKRDGKWEERTEREVRAELRIN